MKPALKHVLKQGFFNGSLTLCLLAFGSVSMAAQAEDWLVNSGHSNVSFVSTKKVDIAEVHKFKQVQGSLSKQGELALAIDLNSVDTGISIRDERMASLLFEVAKYPKLEITGHVNPKLINDLPLGSTLVTQITATIQLHGQQVNKDIDVLVAKLTPTTLVVTSMTPVIVMANEFDLVAGVEKLRDIAGLSSISMAVPVSFVLTLSQKISSK
ncbi:YceI family protein [Shewanella sp. SR44-3]|uniref:YceI family protein n=1 Tax=Shewanella sp. SR44-3 TaxID=2760936 RepID=UPI0015FDEF47|nr:YceI family protein [Shewanella sp. SR44-3]MBB1270325.1 YceI family protein [Shewanella sp. SR44-3]